MAAEGREMKLQPCKLRRGVGRRSRWAPALKRKSRPTGRLLICGRREIKAQRRRVRDQHLVGGCNGLTRQRRSSKNANSQRACRNPALPVIRSVRLRCGRRRVGIGHSIVVEMPHLSLPRKPRRQRAIATPRHAGAGIGQAADSVVSGEMKAGKDGRRIERRGEISVRPHP